MMLAPDTDRYHAIVVHVAGDRVSSAVTNLRHDVVETLGNPIRQPVRDTIADHIAGLVEEMRVRVRARNPVCEFIGMAVGWPGIVHVQSGMIGETSVFEISSFDLRGELARLYHDKETLPVHIDNDANLAGIAEGPAGLGEPLQNYLYIQLGYQVGGSVVLNGNVLYGHSERAGEFGHMIVDRKGPLCFCGNRGCLTAVLNELLPATNDHDYAASVGRMVSGEQPECLRMDEYLEYVYIGIASCVNLFDPELVILGGPFSDVASDGIYESVQSSVRANTFNRSLRVTRPSVEGSGILRGGSIVAFSEFFDCI